MKQKFSTSWKSSKQPRKQRKYLHNLPLHLKQKLFSATLDKLLRKKYERRSLEIRKGDEVIVMRGKFKKKTGKVTDIDRKKIRIYVEAINVTKKDGNKVPVSFHPSNVKIIKIYEDDKKRLKKIKLEKKQDAHKTK